jgi:nucleotide-binding universal stress UspA family protein
VSVEAVVLIDAHPARALLDHVRSTGADLIVMSTHGRGLSRLFVGSVADKVLRGSNCPTLIRRPG